MKNFKPLLFLVLFLLLLSLFGCSNDSEDNQINFDLVASEKTLPANFYEIAYERETSPLYQFLVKKSVNQSEFEKIWNLYGLKKNIPSINFDEKDVLFIGVHESGSCPYKIKNVELSSENKVLTVSLVEPEGDCTSDATPRTFVIEIDKSISKDIENLVIVQSDVETNVPFEN